MEYLKNFKDLTKARAEGIEGLLSPHVDTITGFNIVNYHEDKKNKFKCEFDDDGTLYVPAAICIASSYQDVRLEWNNTAVTPFLQYSYDGINWNTWNLDWTHIDEDNTLYIRGINPVFSKEGAFNHFEFGEWPTTASISGNVMGLINYKNAPLVMPSGETYFFGKLFEGCTCVSDVSSDFLPATGLTEHCYDSMFSNCLLFASPSLPAHNLVKGCYQNMFSGSNWFGEIHCDATDISAEDCTKDWLGDVAENGDFYCPSTTSWTSGVSGIPTGWTRHDI